MIMDNRIVSNSKYFTGLFFTTDGNVVLNLLIRNAFEVFFFGELYSRVVLQSII